MESLLSVGIDVGTTSTHLTISRLHFGNVSSLNQAPRLQINEREVVYSGPVHFTPLSADGLIDAAGVANLIEEDYGNAGVKPGDIKTGAVIITGETARLRNAPQVVEELARLAGDFVVASAGPHLESVLAARGSGATRASQKEKKCICNVDIGGGTVNAAVYSNGSLIDSSCLGIGARFVRVEPVGQVEGCYDSLKLKSVTEPAKRFFATRQGGFQKGDVLSPSQLEGLAAMVGEEILKFLLTRQYQSDLLLTKPLRNNYCVDEYWFTGGVAELMLQSDENLDPYRFGDGGCILGSWLRYQLIERRISYLVPPSPIRATVIGAGLHTTQLSGCTIEIKDSILPLRNVPLIRPFRRNSEALLSSSLLRQALQSELETLDIDWHTQTVAVVVENLALSSPSYAQLKLLAAGLAEVFLSLSLPGPFVIVSAHDIAAALGLMLRRLMQRDDILVIDGVAAEDGDYIDIGSPIISSQLGRASTALPVVIKSLVFRSNALQ